MEDIRQNGVKPLFESVKERVSTVVATLTDPTRLSNAVGRFTERLNKALQVVPDGIRAIMKGLNDRIYGINRGEGKSQQAAESRYWKELTGMNKRQFLLALRKDRDRMLLLGSVSSQGIDLNAAKTANKGRGSSSTGLAKLTLVDLLRGNFQGVYHLRMYLAQKVAKKIINGPLTGEGRLTSSMLNSAVWLQERLAATQTALGSSIVRFHEARISGTTFGEIYRKNDSWTQRYFSPEGSGRSYSELHHAYREAILQKYFNFTMITASLVFTVLLLRRRAKSQLAQQKSENAPEPGQEIRSAEKELQILRLEVEKLKLER